MITAPVEPCFFYIREHDLKRNRVTPWTITGFDPASKNYPFNYFSQRGSVYGTGAINWSANQDQSLRQALQVAAFHTSIKPRPETMYEVVRFPRRLLDFMSAGEVRNVVDNIKESMLLSNNPHLPRRQHLEVIEIQIHSLPANDMEAAQFYKTGPQFFRSIENLRADRLAEQQARADAAAAAQAAQEEADRQAEELARRQARRHGGGTIETPAPVPLQQAVHIRTRGPRGTTVAQTFAYLQRLRQRHAAAAVTEGTEMEGQPVQPKAEVFKP